MRQTKPYRLAYLSLATFTVLAGCDGRTMRPPDDDSGVDVDMAMRRDGGPDMAQPDGGTVKGPKITECPGPKPMPPADGLCTVEAGNDAKLLVGTVLLPGEVLHNGQVLIDPTGKIACAACDCSIPAGGATKIICARGVISPGLINTHDHITFTQNAPGADSGERYEHRHDWRLGARGHTKIPVAGNASADQIAWGELRFLMGGATSTVGSGSANGFLRNLDRTGAQQEGLNQKAVNFETFPLGDTAGTLISSGCAYMYKDTAMSIAAEDAYLPHISEGIDKPARNEFLCSSSSMGGGQDLAQTQSAFIHSIGLSAADYDVMGGDGVALIWSPRSNIRLYGDTAVVTAAARLGVLIAIGTDWTASGSMNMLRELRCADELNRAYYDRYFSDEELWGMATLNAAVATATNDVVGALKVGLAADVAIFWGDDKARVDHRAVIDAEPKDVALVLRGGKVLYGDEAAVKAIPKAGMCDGVDVCGRMKVVCAMGEVGKTFAALKAGAGNSYDAFFCGTPKDEPTCLPSRPKSVMGSTVYDGKPKAGDLDGDGITDAMDNCPKVFNPIRPLDEGKQADRDLDGVGDACDVCPLDKDSLTCKPRDPADQDRDGIPDGMDNCPQAPNMDQKDADMDQKGDVCDDCPMDANMGSAACPGTIYDVKNGKIAVGKTVSIKKAIATAAATNGFFLQVKAGDAGYAGPDFSGVYVYSPMNTVKAGDRVTLTTATVADFFGQIQLNNAMVVVDSSGEAPPAPVTEKMPGVPLSAADLATGGPKEKALEGVLVQLGNQRVTDVMPPPGMADMAPTNEFVVEGALRVNDLFHLANPFPSVGDSYTVVAGVLDYRNGNSKIEPRDANDLKLGPPRLKGFSAMQAFARVGQMAAATIPVALRVELSSAPMMDVTVQIVSADPNALAVESPVKIAAGQTGATVLVSAFARSAGVKLTATYGMDMASTTVRVIDPNDVPQLVSISPMAVNIGPGGMAQVTVGIDVPAPMGGVAVMLSAMSGMVPASVTVPEGQLAASFTYKHDGMSAQDVITATLGMISLKANVNVVLHLVINEVDYDQVGGDMAEFVEIWNPSQGAVDLTGTSLVLVNGSNNTVYNEIKLTGMLDGGAYLVVGAANLVVPMGARKVNFAAAQDNLQNGSPDGVLLVDTVKGKVVDALSYEGSITQAMGVPGIMGMVNLVEGMALVAEDSNVMEGSLGRLPNGRDSDDANADWKFIAKPTPGAPNL